MDSQQRLLGDVISLTRTRVLTTSHYRVWASRGGDTMTNELEENFSYLNYEQTLNKHNVCLLRSTAFITDFIFLLPGSDSVAQLIFTLRDWIRQEGQEDHHLGGQTTR
jgi:hypothetical protein